MKIGVSSYSFQTLLKRGMTYFEACQHARDMGYDGIEFIDLDLAFAPGEDNVESLAKHLRAHCEALDLDIPAYTVAADFLNGRGGAPEDEPARVCRCADIAAHFALSPAAFSRRVSAACGQGPGAYIASQRMQLARNLLSQSDLSIGKISEMCGFENQFYFSSRFKKAFGVCPREYRVKRLP